MWVFLNAQRWQSYCSAAFSAFRLKLDASSFGVSKRNAHQIWHIAERNAVESQFGNDPKNDRKKELCRPLLQVDLAGRPPIGPKGRSNSFLDHEHKTCPYRETQGNLCRCKVYLFGVKFVGRVQLVHVFGQLRKALAFYSNLLNYLKVVPIFGLATRQRANSNAQFAP